VTQFRRDSRFVPVARYADRHEAELVRGMLESAGVPSALRTDDAGGIYPVLSPSAGATVLVPDDDLELAREVLTDSRAQPGAEWSGGPSLRSVESVRRPTSSRRSRGWWVVAAVLLVVAVALGALGALPVIPGR
jgi:hypothetical protein